MQYSTCGCETCRNILEGMTPHWHVNESNLRPLGGIQFGQLDTELHTSSSHTWYESGNQPDADSTNHPIAQHPFMKKQLLPDKEDTWFGGSR